MLRGEVLGECREQGVPALVAHGRGFVGEQADLGLGWLPAILLKELRDQTPPDLLVRFGGQVGGEVG
jgi:hypothetical protein